MTTSRRIFTATALVLGTALLSIGIQVGAATFTPPSSSPPNSDAYAPLTTSPAAQVKVGGILAGAGFGNSTSGVAFGAAGGSIVAYYGNIEAKAAGSFVKAPQLCIGEDCRTAWPGGAGGDTSGTQKRITGTCTVGSAVAAVNEDGTVVCSAKMQAGKLSGVSNKLKNVTFPAAMTDTSYAVSVQADQVGANVDCYRAWVVSKSTGGFSFETGDVCSSQTYTWVAVDY